MALTDSVIDNVSFMRLFIDIYDGVIVAIITHGGDDTTIAFKSMKAYDRHQVRIDGVPRSTKSLRDVTTIMRASPSLLVGNIY
jgi:hypothetical protein